MAVSAEAPVGRQAGYRTSAVPAFSVVQPVRQKFHEKRVALPANWPMLPSSRNGVAWHALQPETITALDLDPSPVKGSSYHITRQATWHTLRHPKDHRKIHVSGSMWQLCHGCAIHHLEGPTIFNKSPEVGCASQSLNCTSRYSGLCRQVLVLLQSNTANMVLCSGNHRDGPSISRV